METEGAFLAALAQASGWTVAGQELTLLDAAGTEVARFDAVYLR
jgi:heat shock protein HslJ